MTSDVWDWMSSTRQREKGADTMLTPTCLGAAARQRKAVKACGLVLMKVATTRALRPAGFLDWEMSARQICPAVQRAQISRMKPKILGLKP